jgi:hypothetical protein
MKVLKTAKTDISPAPAGLIRGSSRICRIQSEEQEIQAVTRLKV